MKYFKIGLILLIGGAFFFYFYHFDPSDQSEPFISCPSKTLLGLNCPGCGSQRLIHNLFHFNFGEAFRYNPLLFILFPFVLYILGTMVSNLFFGTNIRMKLLYQNWFVYLLFGMIILYGILRNLPWHPFRLLAPPEF